MSEAESLKILPADPASPDCRVLIEELDRIQAALYPPENNYLDSIDELQKRNCHFLAAYLDEQIVGCGAVKIVDGAYGLPFPNICFVEAKPFWNDNTILALSLSKLGLPGVRTGIVIAREEIIDAFTNANTIVSLACGNLGPDFPGKSDLYVRAYALSRLLPHPTSPTGRGDGRVHSLHD